MTHDPREALEPCPFCGGNNVILSHKWDYGFIRRYPYCNGCGARGPSFNGEEESRAWWNTRALTASPGEQEPCGWQFCCPDGKWIGCDEPPANELRDEPEKFRRVYLSPPPAAGWDELLLWLVSEIEVVKRQQRAAFDMNQDAAGDRYHARHLALSDVEQKIESLYRESQAPSGVVKGPIFGGTALCGHHVMAAICEKCNRPDAGGGVRVKPLEWHDNRHAQSILGVYSIHSWSSGAFSILCPNKGYPDNNSFPTVDEAKAAAQADYERRILSALSTTPVAAESKASVEARLREALKLLISDIEDYERVNNLAPPPGKNDCWQSVTRAKEALSAVGDEAKESDGGVDWDDVRGIAPNATGDLSSEAFIREQRDSWDDQPSSPTAERREIVARIIDEEIYWDRDLGCLDLGNAIERLAALDGGAGA